MQFEEKSDTSLLLNIRIVTFSYVSGYYEQLFETWPFPWPQGRLATGKKCWLFRRQDIGTGDTKGCCARWQCKIAIHSYTKVDCSENFWNLTRCTLCGVLQYLSLRSPEHISIHVLCTMSLNNCAINGPYSNLTQFRVLGEKWKREREIGGEIRQLYRYFYNINQQYAPFLN